jgi:Xaa-Pro aminopeptidase
VERAHLPLAAREVLAVAQADDLGPALRQMRRRKYEDELACIRRAIAAAEAGHQAARTNIRAGITEMDLYVEVQAAITRAAGEPIVMMGDFAAGERSGRVGGPPTDNVLQPGDLMIFDLFPRIGGYRADIANTLCAGQPTQEQRDHLAVLQAALQAGEATLRPGVTAAEVYAAGREPIAAAGLGDAFPHHAGHGLGLGHPEPPFLVPESQEILQAGDVVTLEPGAYRRGWGGARIEHNYLITETGYQRLSNHQIGL